MGLNRLSKIKRLSARAGLDSLAAQALTSVAAFRQKLSTRKLLFSEVDELYEAAREEREAALIYEKCLLARSSPLLKNAVRLGINPPGESLRDYEEQFGNRASAYTSPGSVSSMFSPAAYLTALYRNARGLYPEESPYHIDKRRPDLKGLLLSQSNMSKEVSALSLSNEVLMTLAGKEMAVDDQNAVLEALAEFRLSASTPYHHPHARLRQSRIQKDPKFKQLAANPRVSGLFSGATMAGMAFDMPPELYTILTEEVTSENAAALYAKNFGDLPEEYLLNPQSLRRYYGLSDEEVTLFTTIDWEGEQDGGGEGEYVDNVLTTMIDGAVYRLQCGQHYTLDFAWLFPKGNGAYELRFSYNDVHQAFKAFRVHLNDGGTLFDNPDWTPPDAGATCVVQIASGVPEGSFTLYLERYRQDGLFVRAPIAYDVSISRSAVAYLLKLNKAIRLWRATGMHPRALETIVNSVNSNNITDGTLQLLFQVQRCVQRYGVEPEEALVLCGGLLSQSGYDDNRSLFDQVFNSPPLNDESFAPSTTQINLLPDNAADHSFEKAVLKRAFNVDDVGLFTLLSVFDNSVSTGAFTLNLKNLSAMYALSRWARLHGLSVAELRQLLKAADLPRLTSELENTQLWSGWLQKVDSLTQWLNARKLSVASVELLTRPTFIQVASTEISALLDEVKRVIDANGDADTLAKRISLLAPVLVSSLALPSAAVAESVLAWANGLRPAEWTVDQFWDGAATNDVKAVAFCYELAQLALIYHATGINPQAFSLFVASPARLLGPVPETVVLPRALATLQALCNFSAWLKSLGDGASTLLAAFVADTLTPADLAIAMNDDAARFEQATEQAFSQAQAASDTQLNAWSEIDAVLQWAALSAAFGVTPVNIGELLALDYAADNQPAWDDWVRVADAFSAGLSQNETKGMEAALASGLSAALCGYLLKSGLIAQVANKSREGLYQYLLLDNLNGPQVMASRVAEAIVSLQTFIQRTLSAAESQGLVDKAAVTGQFFTDWERYNQRYSTWAGAAKLVYYPENYVDPTVRLGQSGMMNTMLQTLGQAQLNTDTVGDAFNTYLNSFEEVANLRVISGYHDNLDVHEGKTYFIGTNQSEVREFYWRSADEGRRGEDGQLAANAWTDWRKIECAAQPWGDCIRPVIYKSRLYLCWLERKDVTPPNTYRALDNAGVFEYAINISYLRYDGNWTSPKMVDVTDELSRFDLENTSLGLYCSNFQKDEAMTVLVYTKIPATSASEEAPDKSLLYVYEDMSINHKAYADAVTFAEYIRHQLDSESATFVVNVYAQALDVDKKLSFFSEQVNDFKMVGDASNITVQDGSSNSGIVLSLSPRFSVEHRLAGWKYRVYREIVLANGGGFVFFHGVHFVVDYDFHVFRSANFIYLVFPLQYDVQYGSLKEAKAYDVVSDTYVSLGVGTRSEASNDGYVIYKISEFRPGSNQTAIPFVRFDFWFSYSIFPFSSEFESTDDIVASQEDICVEITDGVVASRFSVADYAQHPEDLALGETNIYQFNLLEVPVTSSWGESTEITLAVKFKVRESDCAHYTLRLFRPSLDVKNLIQLKTTSDNAQYMQIDAYRTRLNTLFARQLVERAASGIDTILSYETQEIQEPQLGEGFFVTLNLPVYDQAQHGDEKWVRMYYQSFAEVDDNYLAWSGNLSDQAITPVELFVPCPDRGWFVPSDIHLRIQYQGADFNKANNQSVWIGYVPNVRDVDIARPGRTSPLAPYIVHSVTGRDNSTVPMDFSGANALYFWELFYYTPMMSAQRFLQEQQFTLADQWLRYVWSPSGYVVRGEHVDRNWNVRPLQEDISWNDAPLKAVDPDAVAQNDPMHYKVATFMRALDLLIARGDSAYRKLERDTLTEAKVWYSQALNLLGEQPYIRANAQWTEPSLGDASSQALAEQHLTVLSLLRKGRAETLKAMASTNTATASSLFLPEVNEVMQGYWLTLRQRMYNLRHNLTLDGQPLLLPLFAKPADPKALLNAAVAAEGSGGSDLPVTSLPLWRFEPMLDSARGLVFQLIQFGNAVQGVLERQDAESLNALLQNQGTELMASSIRVQEGTLRELEAEKAVLSKAKDSAQKRFDSYSRMHDENINARERLSMEMQVDSQSVAAGAKVAHMTAAALGLAPNIFGLANGGMKYEGVGNAVGIGITMASDVLMITSLRIAQEEMYRRRREEWEIQRNNAEGDIHQIEAQLAALEVRIESAELQKTHLGMQQGHAQAQLDFLQTKFSNSALYSWLRGRLATIYFQFYDLAVSRCLMTEKAWHWESGKSDTYIRGGGWQGTWAGLTCGEGLMLNLAQLETARMKWSKRALEVTRTVSLADFYRSTLAESDPFELSAAVSALLNGDTPPEGSAERVRLDESGALTASITLADLNIVDDYPSGLGDQRRIKQVSVSLPALLGPYQDVQAVLNYTGGVNELPPGCDNMAISRGVNDSGQFQPDFNDPRWLPFEGADIREGSMIISFPQAETKQKALLESLNDIILHISYTIRSS
ncbi:neuraminidase-like domain-containing protein [Pseudomonas syringae]|uniref:Tc toxin subunit A-related protein n=1 Tax=Pseudomonas syringae TaxID=317 RepID=UPI001F0D0FB4|nr:neuraminidase-like domain-containing protein [Pseudomonas syringae]MCH5517861.1 neuraminidase-like domain-containing protein [Pseudomonas syringae pv. lapsa]